MCEKSLLGYYDIVICKPGLVTMDILQVYTRREKHGTFEKCTLCRAAGAKILVIGCVSSDFPIKSQFNMMRRRHVFFKNWVSYPREETLVGAFGQFGGHNDQIYR